MYYSNFVKNIFVRLKLFFKEVFVAIGKTRQSNPFVLWGTSAFIVFFHFVVEYLSFYAIGDIQAKISWQAALWVFLAMTLGLAIPMPGGGAGAYHTFVVLILSAFDVEKADALAYATITHSIQLFNATVVGGISFLIAQIMLRKRKRVKK